MSKSNQIKKVLYCFSIIFSISATSQPMTLNFAHSFGGTSNDEGQSVIVDICGNLYCAGNFKGVVDFDPSASTYTLSSYNSLNGYDGYLSKFDQAGNLIWARQFGGPLATANIFSLCFDPMGNIGFAASCTATLDLDPGPAQFTIAGATNSIFQAYVRIDPSGNFISAFAILGTGSTAYPRLKFDSSGNLLVSGSFNGTVDFDPGAGTYTLTALSNNMHDDAFVCKISPSGNLIWVTRFGGIEMGGASGLDIDATNDVFVTGSFHGTVDFDPGPGTYTLTAPTAGPLIPADGFLLKLASNGTLLWVKQFPAIFMPCIAIDTLGSVYGVGGFTGSRDFDPGPSSYNMSAIGSSDVFACKLDAGGNFIWARQFGNVNVDVANDVKVDKNNTIFVAGAFQSNVDFDPGLATYSLSSFGNSDAFLLQLDENSNFIQARQFGGIADDIAYGVALDKTGSAYLTGSYSGNADFDPGVGVLNLSSNGSGDVFVCKVSLCADVPLNINCSVMQTICFGNTASLLAISNATVNWYSSSTSTIGIGTGSMYTTPPSLSPGTYTYYAEASTCSIGGIRSPFILTVNALPTLSLSAKPATVCPGQSAVLSASGAVTYSWSNAQQGQTITVIPTISTTYSVTGKNTLPGCQSMKTVTVIYSTCTGVFDKSKSEKFRISPNPTTNFLTIETEIEGALIIFDPIGKVILNMQINKGLNHVFLNEYKEGLYIVQLKYGIETFIQKIIKVNGQ